MEGTVYYYMKNDNIIKNHLVFYIDNNKMKEIKKELSGKNTLLDFNKIIPIDYGKEDSKEIKLDKYTCACLNLYLLKNNFKNDNKILRILEFVGITREKPYKFEMMNRKEVNSVRAKYSNSMMLKHAENVFNAIKDKSIFNGYLIRDSIWETGSNADNVKISYNCISFNTYYKPALKVVKELAKKYPDIDIEYTYTYKGRISLFYLHGSKIKIIKQYEVDCPSAVNLIKKQFI